MEFRVLGPFEATLDGDRLSLGAGKQRALLALLALNAGRAVSTEELVDELWGETVPETAHKMVQIYVSQLRKVLPRTVLETRAPGYRVAVDPEAVDSHRFERLLADGRRALAAGRPGEAASLLRDGLSLWRGQALAEFASEPFAQVECGRLEELRLAALEERLEADLALGRHADLVGELDALVARHPLRERLRGQQMLALYRSGRQADALAAYHHAHLVLDGELGIQPSAALRELERRILQQDEALAAPQAAPATRIEGPVRPAAPPPDEPPRPGPVGRDAELGRLREALADALAGRRRLVFVTGDAGLGKTTLVEGFLAAAGGELLVGRGRCVESRECAEAYLPVLDALSRLCRSSHGADVTALLRLHAPTWLTQLPWLVEPDEVEQLERRVFGANRERMRREMGEALDAIAAFQPLVLVLEDLHWGDSSTLDLLGWLAYRDDLARLLVVGTYRAQGDAEAGIGSVARGLRIGRRALEVPLAPLTATAVAELVARRLPDLELGDEVAARLVERTGGNPLFVETVVDAWIADDVPGRDNVGELVGRVPDTVRALVERQLDELSETERTVLEAASVVGGDLTAAAVAAAVERPVDEVEAQLDRLVRRGGSLRACGTADWPDGTVTAVYRFVHELHEQVVYERLPARHRAVLHQRVARRLEAAFGDRTSAISRQLASHYVRAREPERAVRFLMLAAEQSASRSAYPETIEHAHAALEALDAVRPSPERDSLELALQTLLGQTLVTASGWSDPGVETAFLRARALCEQLGDNEPLVPVLLTLGTVYEVRGEFARAQQIVAECLEVVPDADTAADTQELLACSLFHQGAFTRALEHAEVGVSLVEDGLADDDLLASFGESSGIACYDWAALAFWFLGYPDRALERARQAVALAEQPERQHSLAAARATAAFVHQCRHEPVEARQMAERAMAAATERGYRYRLAMGSAVSGWARAYAGDPESGIPLVRRALEISRATGATMDDPYYLGLLAEACLAGARFDEGLDAVAEALGGLGEDGSFYEAELYRVQAALRLRAGDRADDVEPVLREALGVARRQHARSLELRAAVDLARLLAGRGDADAALELVEPVLDGFTEGEEAPDLVAAASLVAQLGGRVRQPVLVHESGVGASATPEAPRRPAPPVDESQGPFVRYARSGDVSVAYQVTGEGPADLVLVSGFVSHLDQDWDDPRHARFLDRLGSFSRLIRFDKRGTGLSDRPDDLPDLETRMDDVRAVMDAVPSERAVVFGYSEGGPMATLFAATYPDRTAALVLYGAYAARVRKDDYPWAATEEERSAYAEQIEREWAWEADMKRMCPSADDELARWWGSRARAAASPAAARRLIETNSLIDVRDVLSSVRVPTLVLHRSEDIDVNVAEGRYIAARIPGAQFVELPGGDHFVAIDPDQIVDEVERFVAGLDAPAASDRVLASILVTDLVGSTETAARVGDRRWSELVARHHAIVDDVLARFGGGLVDTAGDGVLALFDGPARAIRAGLDLRKRLGEIELPVRIGIHTGEIEQMSGAPRGIAVHLTARVAGEAEPGEVLVTSTTRDLVSGSGLAFADRGERALKGFDERRRLYAVVA